jgi:hypothetical protein
MEELQRKMAGHGIRTIFSTCWLVSSCGPSYWEAGRFDPARLSSSTSLGQTRMGVGTQRLCAQWNDGHNGGNGDAGNGHHPEASFSTRFGS